MRPSLQPTIKKNLFQNSGFKELTCFLMQKNVITQVIITLNSKKQYLFKLFLD